MDFGNQLIWIIIGAVLAIVWLMIIRRQTKANRNIGIGLVIAALIYVGFALFGPAPSPWLFIEIIGVVIFAAFAWLGINRAAFWLAAGWAIHIAWDVGLHQIGTGQVFTPAWYPPLCIGFDTAVALGIMFNNKR